RHSPRCHPAAGDGLPPLRPGGRSRFVEPHRRLLGLEYHLGPQRCDRPRLSRTEARNCPIRWRSEYTLSVPPSFVPSNAQGILPAPPTTRPSKTCGTATSSMPMRPAGGLAPQRLAVGVRQPTSASHRAPSSRG